MPKFLPTLPTGRQAQAGKVQMNIKAQMSTVRQSIHIWDVRIHLTMGIYHLTLVISYFDEGGSLS